MTVLKFGIGKLGLLFSVEEGVGALPSYQCRLEGTRGCWQGPRRELRGEGTRGMLICSVACISLSRDILWALSFLSSGRACKWVSRTPAFRGLV